MSSWGSTSTSSKAGKVAPEIQVDVVDAAQADGFPAFVSRLDAFRKGRSAETLALALRPALRTGGDAQRGVQIIMGNPAAECTRCHSMEGDERRADPGEDRHDALA